MSVKVGQRVALVATDDAYTNLRPGDEGEVVLIDSIGTIHVAWDSGSSLGLVPSAGDRFRVIEREETQ